MHVEGTAWEATCLQTNGTSLLAVNRGRLVRVGAEAQGSPNAPRLLYLAAVLDFRLQGGFASPRGSTVGHLSRPYALMAARGVPVRRHVSTTVVSAALAGEAGPDGLTLRPYGGESRSAPTRFPSLRIRVRRRSPVSVTWAIVTHLVT